MTDRIRQKIEKFAGMSEAEKKTGAELDKELHSSWGDIDHHIRQARKLLKEDKIRQADYEVKLAGQKCDLIREKIILLPR